MKKYKDNFYENFIVLNNNKNYKLINIEEIKNFLNIVSSKDDKLLELCYFSAISTAESILGVCLGEKKYKITYDSKNIKNQSIDLEYGPVLNIESINFNNGSQISEIKDYSFDKDQQKIYFSSFFVNFGNIEIIYNAKLDENHNSFENIKLKLLKHINLIYKNKGYQSCEKQDLQSSINNIYKDSFQLLN